MQAANRLASHRFNKHIGTNCAKRGLNHTCVYYTIQQNCMQHILHMKRTELTTLKNGEPQKVCGIDFSMFWRYNSGMADGFPVTKLPEVMPGR